MACPGGCTGGAGQPIINNPLIRKERTNALYHADKMMTMHRAQDNPFVNELYKVLLDEPNSHKAHELLHSHNQSRKRLEDEESAVFPSSEERCKVKICIGTSCFLRVPRTSLPYTLKT
jgi:NADH-quinone oxidoreductase subunit G